MWCEICCFEFCIAFANCTDDDFGDWPRLKKVCEKAVVEVELGREGQKEESERRK